MNVLEMMKKDLTSVVGLRVEYDFGESEPLIGWISQARVQTYKTILDGQDFVGTSYVISFIDHPLASYGVEADIYNVYDNNIKVLGGQ